MKSKMINNVQLSGYIYSHNLTENVSRNNNTYIRGRMEIALDGDFTKVIPVQWLVMESRKDVFNTLKSIIEDDTVTVESGNFKNKGEITRVRISGNIDVNDFISRNTGQMVTYQQIRGAFIHFMHEPVPDDNDCTFSADTYLNSSETVDEPSQSSYIKLRGFVFDFRGHLIPVEFNACTPEGIRFFDDQDISSDDPYFSTVYGKVEPSTVVSTSEEDSTEIGFGEPVVRETTRHFIGWNITTAKVNLGLSEDTVSDEELSELMSYRQQDLADVRQRYESSNSSAPTAFGSAPAAKTTGNSGFVF